MAEQRVNTFGTFLKTVQESSRHDSQQQRSAPGSAVETVLEIVRGHADGIDAKDLLETSGVSVVEFGQVIDRLQKLGAVIVQTANGRELMLPGPQAGEVMSLLR